MNLIFIGFITLIILMCVCSFVILEDHKYRCNALMTELSFIKKSMPRKPGDECVVYGHSSGICRFGTGGCVKRHELVQGTEETFGGHF
jgi:hypothetical protein